MEAAQSRAAKGTALSTDPEIGRILLGACEYPLWSCDL